MSRILTVGLIGIVLLSLGTVTRAEPPTKPTRDEILRQQIDRRIEAQWATLKVVPAPAADDAEYLRRVSLDLIGRIPTTAETRTFLIDTDPAKRLKLVNRLLESPAFSVHFASMIRSEWVPQSFNDPRFIFQGNDFENWLIKEFRQNRRYDEIVRKILSAQVQIGQRGQVEFEERTGVTKESQSIAAFYQLQEGKPESLAATASRVFLGVKLECAQCHDHPFAPYTRDQFWQFAAFFGEFTPLPPTAPSFVGPQLPQHEMNRITIPNTTRTVTARYFDGESPDWSDDRSPRQELTNWLLSPNNPYFARNVANRMWAYFLGTGIIDPVDEPGDANPPSHPELLDDLAHGFIDAKFDLRTLIRAIVLSRPYSLTSRQTDPSQSDLRRFARFATRSLGPNQIYDSFLAATGTKDPRPRQAVFFNRNEATGRDAFRVFFQQNGKATESQTSILQALMMMNGQDTTTQSSLNSSTTLAAIQDAPFLTREKKLEAIYLAVLCRKPSVEEREKHLSYLERHASEKEAGSALADLFWVLLNSTEFLVQH